MPNKRPPQNTGNNNQTEPKFSYAEIAKMINMAKTQDDLDTAISLTTGLPANQIKELSDLAAKKLSQLTTVNAPAPANSGNQQVSANSQGNNNNNVSTVTPEAEAPMQGQVMEREVTPAPVTLKETLLKRMPQIETLLPRHLPPERFMRITFMAIQKNPDLANCTKASLVAAMLKCAEWGLLPDGRQGALIPFNNSKKQDDGSWEKIMEATFLPMYQGLIDLARRSGEIADIFPATICEHDDFDYELGLNRRLVHKPTLKSDRGKPIAYYCVIELKDGTKTFGPGPITVAEVERIRQRAQSKNSPAWRDDFDAMAWKTVIKRNLKFVPNSTELQQAIEYDNERDFGGNDIDLGAIEFDEGNSDLNALNNQLLESKAS